MKKYLLGNGRSRFESQQYRHYQNKLCQMVNSYENFHTVIVSDALSTTNTKEINSSRFLNQAPQKYPSYYIPSVVCNRFISLTTLYYATCSKHIKNQLN